MPKYIRNGIMVTLLILTSVLLGQDRETPAAKPASGGSNDEDAGSAPMSMRS